MLRFLIVFLLVFCFQSNCLAVSAPADFSKIEAQLPKSITLTSFPLFSPTRLCWYPWDCRLYPETLPYFGVNGYCTSRNTTYIYAIYGYEYYTLRYQSQTWYYRIRAVGVAYTVNKPDFILSAPSGGFSKITGMPVDLRNTLTAWAEYGCLNPPCTLACFNNAFSSIFPFDIFLNIPSAAITCPTLEFFGHVYDICWLYELMRWFKYPIALSLLIRLAMQL